MRPNVNTTCRPNPQGDWPQIDPSAYVDSSAQIIGNVRIGPRVYVGPNAVIRADEADRSPGVMPIEIGLECNVQDGVIVHALSGTTVTVGSRSSLAHGCIIHGPCTIGESCFVGFGAKVFDAVLRSGVYVGIGAIVQGVELPEESLAPPAIPIFSQYHVMTYIGTTGTIERAFMKKVVAANLALVEGYSRLTESSQK